jgi:hypothetical protein
MRPGENIGTIKVQMRPMSNGAVSNSFGTSTPSAVEYEAESVRQHVVHVCQSVLGLQNVVVQVERGLAL